MGGSIVKIEPSPGFGCLCRWLVRDFQKALLDRFSAGCVPQGRSLKALERPLKVWEMPVRATQTLTALLAFKGVWGGLAEK